MSFTSSNTPLCPAGHLPLKGGDRIGAPSHVQTTYPTAEMINPSVVTLDPSAVILGLDPRIHGLNLRRLGSRPSPRPNMWILGSSPDMTEAKGDARLYRRRGGNVVTVTSSNTPLCPAGHLPLKGGDRIGAPSHVQTTYPTAEMIVSASSATAFASNGERRLNVWSISPLEGEMPGRAEGGAPQMQGPTPVILDPTAAVILGLDPRIHAPNLRRLRPNPNRQRGLPS